MGTTVEHNKEEWYADLLGIKVGTPGSGTMNNPRQPLVFRRKSDGHYRAVSVRGVNDVSRLTQEQLVALLANAIDLPEDQDN